MEKSIFDAKLHTLKNGLNIISIKRNTQMVSIHVGIKVGALYEKKKEKGISHFIEHMLFKGTADRSNESLNSELEQLGGEYNAYTDYISTVYSITALSEEVGTSLELLGDMIQNSIFPENEMEKERGVILAEIRTSKDDIEDLSFRKANEEAFDKSPLRFDTIGGESTVKKFQREDLIKFYQDTYVPNNSVISVVSPYEHQYIIDLIDKYFGAWEFKPVKAKKVKTEDNKAIRKISYKKDIEQSTIIYTYTFHNLTREEELALKILNHKLGESSNSLLFRELREDKGLAYDVYSDIDLTSYVKTFYIYTAVSPEHVGEAIDVIESCIKKIKNEEIKFDDSTVSLMKKVLRTAVAATIEDSTDLCNYVLHQSIDGESIYEFIEDMKNLEHIKKEHIYSTARKVFKDPAVHILMPEEVKIKGQDPLIFID